VDDEPDALALLEKIFKREGATVYTAKNGKAAVDLALEHNPDVILMDIRMPELSGVDAAKMLHEKGFKKPVIALTACHPAFIDFSTFSSFIAKPFGISELTEAVKKHSAYRYLNLAVASRSVKPVINGAKALFDQARRA